MSRIRPLMLFVGALAIACAAVRADSVDDAVAAIMHKRRIPGLSLAVIQDGAVIRATGYGLTDGTGTTPVTTDTLFQAGSVSKSVAALGALRLVESGKLSLDADVNGTLTSWHVPENEFTKESKVTLRRILSHSAGMTVHGFGGYAVGDSLPTLVQVLDGAGNSDPIRVDTVPGTKWRYSGGGYTVMQQLVVDVTGQPFPKFMKENVLDPLGMRASTFAQPLPKDLEAKAATGHAQSGLRIPGRWHVYPEMAAAGLWATPTDLARFVIAVQQSYAGRSSPVISEKMTREMVALQKDDDGLGVFISGEGSTRRFEHNGRDEGFDALMIGYVERGQGAVIMINCNNDSSAVTKVVDAVADAYAWPDYPRFKPPPPLDDKEPAVTAQVRAIIQQAQSGEFDRTLFTPKLGDLIATALSGPMGVHLKELGEIKSIDLVWRKNYGDSRNYVYRIVCENDTVAANCTYDPQGTISGFSFKPE